MHKIELSILFEQTHSILRVIFRADQRGYEPVALYENNEVVFEEGEDREELKLFLENLLGTEGVDKLHHQAQEKHAQLL